MKNLEIRNCRKNRLYRIYLNMKSRCYNANTPYYKYYGAKGIKICDEWLSNFDTFRDWSLKNGYSDNLTLDRIDNNSSYSPKNCRWATISEQHNNYSQNVWTYTRYGKLTMAQLGRVSGLGFWLIRGRVRAGWTGDKLLEPKHIISKNC